MSKLDGLVQSLSSPHPQPMIGILYEEIFDQYDPNDEIDVVIAYKRLGNNELEVKDFRVARVNTTNMEEFEGSDIEYMKKVDAWARSVEGADRYMLIHKHREGMPRPSMADVEWSGVLSTIDYARSEHVPRDPGGADPLDFGFRGRFYGMAVVNRELSSVVAPDPVPAPVGDREIDTATLNILIGILREGIEFAEKEAGWTRGDEMRASMEKITQFLDDLFDAEEAGSPPDEVMALADTFAEMMMDFLDLGAEMRDAILNARGVKNTGLDPAELIAMLRNGESDEVKEVLDGLFHAEGLETNTVYKLGSDGRLEKVDGTMEEIAKGKGLKEIDFGPIKPAKPDTDMFPILGRPATPAPKQPIAADHHEPAPAEQPTTDRPEVPDAFGGLEIDFS